MIEVTFDIEVVGEGDDTPLLDSYELDMMLEHTRAQINQHVQRSLGDLLCDEHQQQAKVKITGTYSLETEQLEVSYDVQTCCKPFLVKAVAALNRR